MLVAMPRPPLKITPRIASTAYLEISHAGETYRISLRRMETARRFTLRVRTASQDVILTMPARGSLSEASSFAARHAAWIGAKLRRLPEKIPFLPGAVIPLRGIPHEIAHCPESRSGVWIEPGAARAGVTPLICVSAGISFVPRRVHEYLIGEAKRDIELSVACHTRKLGVAARKITLRDTTSRWGSCSAAGTLSFSWRLILAPSFVLDYLAAHETAHLLHMNHSARFWSTVARLSPDVARAEAWLKANGSGLLRFGGNGAAAGASAQLDGAGAAAAASLMRLR